MEHDIDGLIRRRIRALRLAKGWSLDTLAARCFLSPSTLSRIETGDRRLALDQLVPIARVLEVSLDELVESGEDEDVVIRPEPAHHPHVTNWLLSRDRAAAGMVVVKTRLHAGVAPTGEPRVHPGWEWFTVLSGRAHLQLGDRVLVVEPGEAAEFSTMVPHRIAPVPGSGDLEILSIFNRDGERAHLHEP
ncbi:helix-turn-helix domain-containing protein [Kineococcus sp. R8]|uniref:helix-turn-helix domain-containing protein n=1 Tax=Kineococcus siccus TaxID=2696567 RepID=UPI00141331DE|nr:XRE family transcriptional regulator [Kineococcus siccus]NAZ83244.1 helix-turn-helix domain-containing protein [Kineococcus siccus]